MTHQSDRRTLYPNGGMDMSRQYVCIKFREKDRRTYTYHNDGPPLEIGDQIDIEGRGGKPISTKILSIHEGHPGFVTKAIIGKAKPAVVGEDGQLGAAVELDIDFGQCEICGEINGPDCPDHGA